MTTAWKNALIYQIYPRSYFDTSGSGIGDLKGITQKLDYIQSLNVDAIWISPFYPSPMADFGYDVADYKGVSPLFGSLDDFDELVSAAHARTLKVMIDIVFCHNSDQHPWFEESRQSKDNPKSDWYVWADPKADGTEPNNWLSYFGGRAWSWEPKRKQYYLRHFLKEQPNLNYTNPEVRKEMLETTKFWLDRGVDGFRIDAIHSLMHDPLLRDNPARKSDDPFLQTVVGQMPFGQQKNDVHQLDQPATLEFLKELRAVADEYQDIFLMGEISADDGMEASARYTDQGRILHGSYNFDLLGFEGITVEHIRKVLRRSIDLLTPNAMSFAIGNHDVSRVVSRWGQDAINQGKRADFSKLSSSFLLSLYGNNCFYQGDELGLPEAEVPFEKLQDPYGIEFWPEFKGRDGCRTPIPWVSTAPSAGFTTGEPWLPVSQEHSALAVDVQEADPQSVLNWFKTFSAWRKDHPALRADGLELHEKHQESLIVLKRFCETETLNCFFNFSNETTTVSLQDKETLIQVPGSTATDKENTLTLPPYAFAYTQVK